MFSLVFSLILGPAIVAFLLGLSAHALKQMTASLETETGEAPPANPIQALGETAIAPSEEETVASA